jgi:hypothetical protein
MVGGRGAFMKEKGLLLSKKGASCCPVTLEGGPRSSWEQIGKTNRVFSGRNYCYSFSIIPVTRNWG